MKLIIDGRLILPQMTGIGRYLCELVLSLSNDPQVAGSELWIYDQLPKNHPVYQINPRHFSIRPIPFPHMSLRAQWEIPLMLQKSRPTIFHYPHFDLPWFTPGAIVATIHDLKYIACPEFFLGKGHLKRLLMKMMTQRMVQKARRIIAVSEFSRQDLASRFHTPLEKIIAIPHGVDERFFQRCMASKLENFRHRYNFIQPYILFVGERRPHKNIPGLIQAFAIFRRTTTLPYKLIIAGKKYADYFAPEMFVDELNLSDYVVFTENFPEADLAMLFQAADAFCLLSHYEGFGLPVLEAMASGTPVVASNRTALPEVSGKAAILVNPFEPEETALALKQIIPGGEFREQNIIKGLQNAGSYTWQRCAQKTLEVYQQAEML